MEVVGSGSGWNGSIEAKRAPLLSDFYLGWFYTIWKSENNSARKNHPSTGAINQESRE
ncbi:hypothetical protein [Paenibacillus sp. J45TS6]|uniref:hypothetical protein n=1 Tax=Paenibacillus sp. J45TS6 TaxID=2807196 RepID=UPI001BD00332|nr:hypothetical protein [Paenibacillus sp. J45TS6]